MIHHLQGVLSVEMVALFQQDLRAADWRDGRITAGVQSAQVKQNEQVFEHCPVAQRLGKLLLGALEKNPDFISAALPHVVYPPMFNRYGEGMGFGAHTDNAIRAIPGVAGRIRTDLSATLFLAEPDSYDGGELVITEGDVTHQLKLPAGDMVLYPAGTVHAVAPVTSGVRVAAFFWVQSMVADQAARDILYGLDSAIRGLAQEAPGLSPQSASILQLTGCYHSLVRRWAVV